LFNITKPHCAVFGQKDAQQAIILKRMVHDLNFDLEMIIAPIVREADGLALSSRNKYLNQRERHDATILYKSLMEAQKLIHSGEFRVQKIIDRMKEMITSSGQTRIDYIKAVDCENLEEVELIGKNTLIAIAAFVGKTRLIDNILIENIQ